MAKRQTNPFGGGYKPPKQPKEPPPPRRPDLEAILCRAMREKRSVSFKYRDTDMRPRLYAPLVAWESEEGSACVNGDQLQSETGASEVSKQTFTIAKMRELQITDASFAIPSDFDLFKHRDRVICIVSPR